MASCQSFDYLRGSKVDTNNNLWAIGTHLSNVELSNTENGEQVKARKNLKDGEICWSLRSIWYLVAYLISALMPAQSHDKG